MKFSLVHLWNQAQIHSSKLTSTKQWG